jgi:serine/threonine-protein kinase
MIGQLVGGKYRIDRLLGEGGMGAVYEAFREGDGERCAVKVINNEVVASDETLVARFEREAQAAKKVKSRHVVETLDAGRDEATGHPFLVMELLEGENAFDLLRRLGPLPPALAVRIAVQTCRGLSDAHKAGVVHRDVKPANLFLTDVGNDELVVKLLDFGVAKFKMDHASQTAGQSLTRTGSMLGSPMYMSPEQARGFKTIDHRADIWSLGIVLYQLLSGRVPNEHIDGLGELIMTICSEPPVLVSTSAPWVSERLAHAVQGALRLPAEDRYQSAEAMMRALAACFGRDLDGDWSIKREMLVALDPAERFATPSEIRSVAEVAEATAPTLIANPPTASGKAVPKITAKLGSGPMSAPTPPTTAGGTLAMDEPLSDMASHDLVESMAAEAEEAAADQLAEPVPVSVASVRRPMPAPARGLRRLYMGAAVLCGFFLGLGGIVAYSWFGGQDQGDADAATARPTAAPPAAMTQAAGTGTEPAVATTMGDTAPVSTNGATADTASTAEPAPSADAAGPVTHKVKIIPAGAFVTVDGNQVDASQGTIELTGEVGSEHKVEVQSRGGPSRSVTVRLGEKAAQPASVAAPPAPGAVIPKKKAGPREDIYE